MDFKITENVVVKEEVNEKANELSDTRLLTVFSHFIILIVFNRFKVQMILFGDILQLRAEKNFSLKMDESEISC